ncbi:MULTISPECIES: YfbU family protein [unclassified Bradyrhizobium]|uniref:YfbU family protein n=1 Tax=unclassified Bradyrhizobium TaxID=2631580 RepID=UPI0029162D76|nr:MULTISPECIES: YfbU family protein [unclassified Bradyrhizobium]
MKLTDGEKLIVLMLADLQRGLKLKGNFDPDLVAKAVLYDNLWALKMEHQGIPWDDKNLPTAVSDTIDILDMWSFIESGYGGLAPIERERVEAEAAPFGKNVKFPGFDGNNEEYYHLAKFLVEDLGRFSKFKGRSLNSHSIAMPGYRRMYELFEHIRPDLGDRPLMAEEIISLLKARMHPY